MTERRDSLDTLCVLLQDLNRTCRSMQQRVVELVGQGQSEDVTSERATGRGARARNGALSTALRDGQPGSKHGSEWPFM